MNVNNYITKNYEKRALGQRGKNKAKTKPIQTQFKANTNPIQTQYKAKQTQFHPHRHYAFFNFLLWGLVRRKL